jgi:glycosyltransferase involved in cell wall biosynthesis
VVATTEGATWMVEQLRELREQHGCDVSAVVSGLSGSLIDKLSSAGIPHFAFSFNLAGVRELLSMPLAVIRLARFFRQQRFDIVQSHVFMTMLFARPAAWLADVPVRLAMISGPFHLEAQASRLFERVTHWLDTMLIPSCEHSFRLCRTIGVSEGRLALIYYGADENKFDLAHVHPVDFRRRFGWGDDVPLVGLIAYFYRRLPRSSWVPRHLADRGVKGHEDLINATPLVLAEFPAAKILLIGPGWGEVGEAYRQELEAMVIDSGLEESVIFTGYHEDVNGVLRDLDVAVQASLSENLGGTIEALLMACPLVATRVGGMPDAVRDGETGVLVNASDPQDLARGIIEQLRDRERARTLAAAGRKLALERFTLHRTVNDLHELYTRLIKREGDARQKYRLSVSFYRLLILLFAAVLMALWFVPQRLVLKIWIGLRKLAKRKRN